ncbi:MAG: hypothetical protein AB7F53_08885 [Nitrososphaeraceae archaeon]
MSLGIINTPVIFGEIQQDTASFFQKDPAYNTDLLEIISLDLLKRMVTITTIMNKTMNSWEHNLMTILSKIILIKS